MFSYVMCEMKSDQVQKDYIHNKCFGKIKVPPAAIMARREEMVVVRGKERCIIFLLCCVTFYFGLIT